VIFEKRQLVVCALSAVSSFALVNAVGGGTDAIGIDHCRAIENARCEAAAQCGEVDDVEACKRFYRDQCLHGLPGVESPSKARINECVEAIAASGECAEDDPEAPLSDCSGPALTRASGQELDDVCHAIQEPQRTNECDFLLPEDEGEGGAAGEGG
jgi:hypothetical protein